MTDPLHIVAEITVNWDGCTPRPTDGRPVISKRFEHVIEVNHARGYDLVSHSLAQVIVGSPPGQRGLTETIIAVFRRRPAKP